MIIWEECMYYREIAALRFWTFVDQSQSCWIWKGAKTSTGYGLFIAEAKKGQKHQRVLAHRYAWSLANDQEISFKHHLHHTCGNRLCVNPTHLELTTVSKHRGLHAKAYCKRGHLKPGKRCKECNKMMTKIWWQRIGNARRKEKRQLERQG